MCTNIFFRMPLRIIIDPTLTVHLSNTIFKSVVIAFYTTDRHQLQMRSDMQQTIPMGFANTYAEVPSLSTL